jgi:hypothetical protein
MPSFDDVRRLAHALPGVEDATHMGREQALTVAGKTFALTWDGRTILKLDKRHQDLLFEIRPDTFQRCKVGTGYWSFVALDDLATAELAELVREAWGTVVPKKLSQAVLGGLIPPL